MNHDSIQIAKNTEEVLEILNIGGSTLRKWCMDFEKQNYFFTQVEQDKRLFYEKDIELLKQYQKEKKGKKLKDEQKENIIKSILSAVEEDESAHNGTTSVPMINDQFQERTTSVPVEFLGLMEQLMEQVKVDLSQQFKQEFEQHKEELKAEVKQTMQDEIKELKEQINHYESKAVEELRISMKETATTKKRKKWFFW